jgi:serine/threonine protein phosphatase PrpC
MIKVYSYTGKGNREINEDYIKSEILSNSVSLHIVADGMGGYQYGEVASQIATESIFQFIVENTIEGDVHLLIQQAVEFANNQIHSKRNQYHAKLGTTLAGVLLIKDVAYAFWLGDVQIQHFRDNKQFFISENHSLINDMKKNGVVSTKEIERYKHIVTRSLSGTTIDTPVPIVDIQLKKGDIICISSDGLYNSINPVTLIKKTWTKIKNELVKKEITNEDNFSLFIIETNIFAF